MVIDSEARAGVSAAATDERATANSDAATSRGSGFMSDLLVELVPFSTARATARSQGFAGIAALRATPR